jgi:hypothetical protein
MTRVTVFVRRPRLRLAPVVIDLTGEAVGDKKINRSDGCGEKWEEEITVRYHPTNQTHAELADGLVGRVG